MSARIYNEKLSPRDMAFLRYLMQHDYTQQKHRIFILHTDMMLHLGQPTYTMFDYGTGAPSSHFITARTFYSSLAVLRPCSSNGTSAMPVAPLPPQTPSRFLCFQAVVAIQVACSNLGRPLNKHAQQPHSSHARVPHIVSFLCIHRRPDSADRKHKCHDARSHVTPVFRQTPATNPSASQLKAVPPSFASTSFTLPPPSRNTTLGCNQSLWLPSADAECAERTKSPYLQLQTMVLPHTTLHGSSPCGREDGA
ncbi:hypothetical protein B0H10DRAFT_2249137 [Mycena sp. CBHHK59/15]|nr:hypothetical protein B0H10DRAFT_2249137 [Mycena sp. CBHHK59/15]